VKFEVNWPRGS